MKIAIDIRNIGKKRTGDEDVFFNLVKNLAIIDKENKYILLTDRDPARDSDLQEAITALHLSNNFQVIHLAENGTNKFFWNFFKVPFYLQSNPVDILQVQYITPFFVSKKIKIVTIVHDVSFKVFPEMIGKMDLFFLNLLLPLSLHRADKVIGVSKFTTTEIKKYYQLAEEKLAVIQNAVADNFSLDISSEQMELVRKKYALPEKFILYIGTLQPRKNLPALIEAYIKIPTEKRVGLKLVLAGGRGHNVDPKIDEFIRNYSLQDEIVLPGFVAEQDKAILFKLAWAFCYPSCYEGFGIPILEAMTLGVPTLASGIAPHLEVAGESILFFDIDNPVDFAEKLTMIVANDIVRADLKQKELQQSHEFSWQKSAQNLLEIYNRMKTS